MLAQSSTHSVKKKLKSLIRLCRNLINWLLPFIGFLLLVALTTWWLRGNFEQFKELTQILIWPITVLLILFFFRKVATYLFFSMDEFNFFGAKGSIKNVNELINEEVEKRFLREKEKEIAKKEIEELAKKLGDKSATAEENLNVARDIFKIYRKYKKDSEKTIDTLIAENKILKENISKAQLNEVQSPVIAREDTSLGAGEQIGDAQGKEPT